MMRSFQDPQVMKQGLLYYQLGPTQSQQGQQLISQAAEENMSNLTTASGEASGNSSGNPNHKQTPPAKKKRNQPGNPDPDAEVVALSPKTLMATNRFVCEICNKGFQRDQNLQLHRRGHNLPWKLKQRSSKEVRKRVYICPEVGCVHHNPDRALGDLTGIKKHFSRKHGEKKWKCERCNKRYAVLSDWKAHSKTCGTREYRCDCGTLFSRRDSFITHRAFCDALTEESARATIPITNHLLPVGPAHSSSSSHLHQQTFKKKSPASPEPPPPPPSSFLPHRPELPPWLTFTPAASAPPPPPSIVEEDEEYYSQAQEEYLGPQDDVYSPSNPSRHHHHHHHQQQQQHDLLPYGFTPPAHMSATALLQKAAQMGTMPAMPSSPPSSGMVGVLHRGHVPADGSSRASCVNNLSSSELMIATPGFVHNTLSPFEYSKAAAAASSSFGGPLMRGPAALALAGAGAGVSQPSAILYGGGGGGSRIGDDLTRDFLGLRALSRRDIMSMAGLGGCMNNTSTSNGHLY